MLDVFLDVVLPVALVAILGGVFGHWRGATVAPISALVFYLFSPALVFSSLSRTELSADVSLRIVGVILVTFAIIYAGASLWSLLRRHDPSLRAGFALGATTPNTGNMGLPVAQLAFGDAGLQVAVVAFVAGAVLVNSAGIAVASLAGGARREVLAAPFRYLALYAAAAGVAVNVLGVDLPTTIDAPVRSLAAAAVPTMLVVLGLQLRAAGRRDNLIDTSAASLPGLAIAPGAAWLAAGLIGLDGATRATLVVLAAMPTAVITTILATKFNAQPAFVTRVVVTSTLASMLSLTLLITLVR